MKSGKIPLDNNTPRRNPRRSCVKQLSFKVDGKSDNYNGRDFRKSTSRKVESFPTTNSCYTKRNNSKCPEKSTGRSKIIKIRASPKGSSKMLKNTKCSEKTAGPKIIKIKPPPRGSSKMLKKYWEAYDAENDAFIHDQMKISFNKEKLRANINKFMKISGLPLFKFAKENPRRKNTRSKRKSSKATNCTSQNTRKKSQTNKAPLQSEFPSVIHPYAETPSYSNKVLSEEALRAILHTREILKRIAARKKMYYESIAKQKLDKKFPNLCITTSCFGSPECTHSHSHLSAKTHSQGFNFSESNYWHPGSALTYANNANSHATSTSKYLRKRSIIALNNELSDFVDTSKRILLHSLGSAATSSLQSLEVPNKIPLTSVVATTSSTVQSPEVDSTIPLAPEEVSTSSMPRNTEIGDMVPFTAFRTTDGALFSSTRSGTSLTLRQQNCGSHILSDVVAYVDIISHEDEDISVVVMKQLLKLGATVTLTLNKSDPVTHILFNDGHVSTYKKAKKRNIPLVSVLWIEECRRIGTMAPCGGFPPPKMERYECPRTLKALKKRKFLYTERKVPRKERKRRKNVNIVQQTPQTENEFKFTPCTDFHGPAWVNDIPGVNGQIRILVNMTKISEEEFREIFNDPEGSTKYETSPLPIRLLHKLTRNLGESCTITSSSENESSSGNGTLSNDLQCSNPSDTIITADTLPVEESSIGKNEKENCKTGSLDESCTITSSSENESSLGSGTLSNDLQRSNTSDTIISADTLPVEEMSIGQNEKEKCNTGSRSKVIKIADVSKKKKLRSVKNNIDSLRELRGARKKRVPVKAGMSKTI